MRCRVKLCIRNIFCNAMELKSHGSVVVHYFTVCPTNYTLSLSLSLYIYIWCVFVCVCAPMTIKHISKPLTSPPPDPLPLPPTPTPYPPPPTPDRTKIQENVGAEQATNPLPEQNVDLGHRPIYAALGGDELTELSRPDTYRQTSNIKGAPEKAIKSLITQM